MTASLCPHCGTIRVADVYETADVEAVLREAPARPGVRPVVAKTEACCTYNLTDTNRA